MSKLIYAEGPLDKATLANAAFTSAEHDHELLDVLEKNNYLKEDTRNLIMDLRNAFLSGKLGCRGVKVELKKYFKKNPQAVNLATNYHKKLQMWVEGKSDYHNPPQLLLQRLPPLSATTLPRYFSYFGKKVSDTSREYCSMGEEERTAKLSGDEIFKIRSIENCAILFEKFINESEEHARDMLVAIFENPNSPLLDEYADYVRLCVRRLVGNVHFLRSLFNLLGENLYDSQTLQRIDGLLVDAIFEELTALGICHNYTDPEVRVDNGFPRPRYFLNHTTLGRAPENRVINTRNIAIPTRLIPAHWNSSRLVNPHRNPNFQEFGKVLDKIDLDSQITEKNREYRNGLVNRRRYSLGFSRIAIDEIPGAENWEIWFYFFHHNGLRPGEIGVEINLDGASTVLFIDEFGYISPRDTGNANPPIPIPQPGTIDMLYGEIDPYWAPPKAMENLCHYILKYAYYLLVEPRTNSPENNDVRESANQTTPHQNVRFNISLSEYSSEITIPSSARMSGDGTSLVDLIIKAHHEIDGHTRRLPAGWRASVEATEEANRHNIFLTPGQTFVKPYKKGKEMNEELNSRKKREN